jgi:hypothetical protein
LRAANDKRSMGCRASGPASSWSLQVKRYPVKIRIDEGHSAELMHCGRVSALPHDTKRNCR